MTPRTSKPETVTFPYPISRSSTVSRIRAQLTRGLAFSGDTPHTSSQLSLFDERSGLPTNTPAPFARSIERGPVVVCIRKPRTKPFDTSSLASIAKSTAPNGQRDGMEASSGHAARSFTKTAGSISTHCYQRPLLTLTTLSLATSGMSGGTANLVAIKSSNRVRKPTLQATSPSTSPKTAKSISPAISERGHHHVPTTP